MPRRRFALIVACSALASMTVAYALRPLSAADVDSSWQALAAPLLEALIVESRDAALREGVQPIPADIRRELLGYVPEPVLDTVRWRVGGGGAFSLQRGLIGFGYTPAVTLDFVVVFEHTEAARDPKLWVHELRHVEQFSSWGVAGFATRYLHDHAAIETDAAEYRWTWMKLTGRVPKPLSS